MVPRLSRVAIRQVTIDSARVGEIKKRPKTEAQDLTPLNDRVSGSRYNHMLMCSDDSKCVTLAMQPPLPPSAGSLTSISGSAASSPCVALAVGQTGPNQVWQLNFSELEAGVAVLDCSLDCVMRAAAQLSCARYDKVKS